MFSFDVHTRGELLDMKWKKTLREKRGDHQQCCDISFRTVSGHHFFPTVHNYNPHLTPDRVILLCNWRWRCGLHTVEWAGRQKGSYFPDISCPPYRDGGWDHVSLTYDSNLIEAEDIKSSLIPILSGYQAISEGFVMWTKASGIILRPLFCTSHHPNISSSNSFGLMIDVDPCTPRLKVRVQCVNMIIDVFIDISVKLWPRSFL